MDMLERLEELKDLNARHAAGELFEATYYTENQCIIEKSAIKRFQNADASCRSCSKMEIPILSISLLQSFNVTRNVRWIRFRLYELLPCRSILRHLLPLIWVYFAPFDVPFGDILESGPGPSNVSFTLTELIIQQFSRKPVIFHPVYMTQPSGVLLNQNVRH